MNSEKNPIIEISIITPVYNSREFIDGCIENVAAQKVEGLEHIVMDGASSDGTAERLRELAERHSHLRVVSERDSGQSEALNKGIRMARGAIVGSLNVDDYYEPDVLQDVVQAFKAFSPPSIYVGNCNVWDSDGSISFVSMPSRISFQSMLRKPTTFNFPVNSSAYFYHRALHDQIGDFDTKEDLGMDMDLLLRIFRVADIHYVDRLIGNFRLLENTKTYRAMQAGLIPEITQKILNRQWARMPWHERWRLKLSWTIKQCFGQDLP